MVPKLKVNPGVPNESNFTRDMREITCILRWYPVICIKMEISRRPLENLTISYTDYFNSFSLLRKCLGREKRKTEQKKGMKLG